ncbi:hypothetical protein BH18VER2_BH18VER2_11550 [soil metagenome]
MVTSEGAARVLLVVSGKGLGKSMPGIFAAGDVHAGSVKRCAAAVGEGGIAVAGIHAALAESDDAKPADQEKK